MKPIAFMRLRHLSQPEDVLKKCKAKDLVVEQKYDGFKILASRERDGTKLYSRNGKDLTANAPKIVARLDKLLEPGDAVLGEMVYFIGKRQSLGSVQSILHSATASRAQRMDKELGGKLEFLAYDMLAVGGHQIANVPWSTRRSELERKIPARGKVRRTKLYPWSQRAKAISDALAAGGEGIVIKNRDGKYKFRKVSMPEPWGSWWKYKVVGEKANTEDVILDGYAKREKRLAFKMYQIDPSGKKVFVGYVSNLPRATEKEVAQLNDRGKVVVAEISHQERFPSGKFRHPGWIRLRPDKPIKSATMTKLSSNPRKRMAKQSNYNAYVVKDEGDTLRLYTFNSDEYIQPHASALHFALWAATKEHGTIVFDGDKDLKKYLKSKRGARLTRGAVPKGRQKNPRNSKVKDALAIEATRHEKFADFASEYWDACARGLYWYPTDEKRFHIGEAEKRRIEQGKFTVHCSPSLALQGANAKKKFVAELDLTKVPKSYIRVKRGEDGARIQLTDGADRIKILRVLEAPKAKRAFKWQLSILPSSKEELRKFWEQAWAKRKKKAERAAIRKRKEKEREAKRALRLAQKEREARERELERQEREAKKAKATREARGKAAKRRKATVARAKEEVKAAKAAKKKASSKKKASKKKASKKKGSWKRVPVQPKDNPIRKVSSTKNKPRAK